MKSDGTSETGYQLSLIDKILRLPALGCLILITIGVGVPLVVLGMSGVALSLVDLLDGLVTLLFGSPVVNN